MPNRFETFVAEMDGFALNILDISNTNSFALHKHEFIGTDGASIDNMGRRPQELKFRTFWFGSPTSLNKISPTYANHFLFINNISDSTISHTLTHPKYGEIQGYVETYTTAFDDTQEYATIDITYVEKDIQDQAVIAQNALNLSNLQVSMLNAELAKVASQFQSGGFGSLLNTTVDFSKDLNSQFNKLTTPVRNFLKECDKFLNSTDKFLSNITQPVATVDSLVSYASDVPSRLILSMNQAANRIVGSTAHLSNLPAQAINSMILQTLNLKATVTGQHASFFSQHLLTVCAGNLLVQTGNVMTADDNNRKLAKTQEKKQAFDASGNRINTVVIPILLSSAQIDSIMYQTRNFLQLQVLQSDRDNPELKQMASSLIGSVDTTKLKKTQQVSLTVNNIPIHLLCLQLGIPYNGADRIYALNPGILNPTFTEGAITTYVS